MKILSKTKRRLIVFHTAYDLESLMKLHLEIFITSRNASGVFQEVITINALSDLQNYFNVEPLNRKPSITRLDETNVVIEGFSKRFNLGGKFEKMNFVIAQLDLIFFLLRKGYMRNISLVRGEDPRFNGIYAFILSKFTRAPLLIGVWGNPGRIRTLTQKPIMQRLFSSVKSEEVVERFILKRADLVAAQNRENLSYALELDVDPKRTRITPLGIGLSEIHFASPQTKRELPVDVGGYDFKDEFIFLCVSRLEPLKMVDHAILACSKLNNLKHDFKLIIVGDGSQRKALEELVRDLRLTENIIFVGNQTQEYIAKLSALAYLNVAPLCGRSLLEVSLSGCPSVAYDVDWHGEIVIDKKTGLLVKNLEVEKFGLAILSLCEDRSLRNMLSDELFNLANLIGNPKKIIETQREMYLDLVRMRNSRTAFK